jgi:uroporphyrinogen-III synthase
MKFTHVFISRPRKEAEELAEMLVALGLQSVTQPAFNFFSLDARSLQNEIFNEMSLAGPDSLLIFTSPRSVAHGLSQLPDNILFQARVAAIGPATAKALGDSGIRVNVTPQRGYTSEALLEFIADESSMSTAVQPFAFIIAAPGGRQKLLEGLKARNWRARLVMVYQPEPAELDRQTLKTLGDASGVLSVWTSANAMKALSQRLPPATWFQLCQGDWLVISERLKRLARAYGPERIHLAQGPGNGDLLSAIRGLV